MEPGETLGIAAQIAVALAGFAGVVVVFGRVSAHEWSPIDKFRLRQLLTNSIFPLALCVANCVWLAVPQPTEWQRIGNQIDVAIIFARADFVSLLSLLCRSQKKDRIHRVKYWEVIADNLSKAGWDWHLVGIH